MNEIKFRAWEKKLKEIIPVYNIDLEAKIINRGSAWRFFHEVELMPSTGLRDKNGVEIYEGDILKVFEEDDYIANRDSGGGIIDYDIEEGFLQLGKVSFKGSSFVYETIKTIKGKHEKIYLPIDWLENYEVIGNIYENKELLEEK